MHLVNFIAVTVSLVCPAGIIETRASQSFFLNLDVDRSAQCSEKKNNELQSKFIESEIQNEFYILPCVQPRFGMKTQQRTQNIQKSV